MSKKIMFYMMSLFFLAILVFIASVNWPVFCYGSTVCTLETTIDSIFNKDLLNISSIFSIILFFTSLFCFFYFYFADTLNSQTPCVVRKVEDINYEHLSFFATYIIPLVAFDFSKERNLVLLIFLLLIIGSIYVKTDRFYTNPTLAIFGYKIYRADITFANQQELLQVVLITKDQIFVDDRFGCVTIEADKVFFGSKL